MLRQHNRKGDDREGIAIRQAGADGRVYRHGRSVALVAFVGFGLAGCTNLRPTQQAFAPDEYHLRHPIKLSDSLVHMDVFETGMKLDRRQHIDVVEFGKEYGRAGRGPIHAMVPQTGSGHSQIQGIRSALAEAGIRAPLQISSYPADPQRGAAPVRLSFMRLQASVDSKCGLWPKDVGGIKDLESWHNRPFHNLGCSYQSMMAAQVADPVDLVRPRSDGQVDSMKRIKDIEALRKDQDPSTSWNKDDTKIKEAQQ